MTVPNLLRSDAKPLIAALAVFALLATDAALLAGDSSPLGFAWKMAKGGNWREAKYRWERLLVEDPDNPRLLNNLAVAQEALGQAEAARLTYERAVAAGSSDRGIDDNRRSSASFWAPKGGVEAASSDAAPAGKVKSKATRLPVELPVPPRIDMTGLRQVLVARFITDETPLLDTGREAVHLMRDELRKCTEITVLPVTPAPAVPEQTIDALAANREFWKRLGREHGADLIVSGALRFERRDSSGFRDVDSISSVTGQKVRQTRFVEQERFVLELDLLFMDGATGDLRFRDRLNRAVVVAGTHNDPISAFFELGDALAPDVLAIVRGRKQQEMRYVFKQ